MRPLALSTSWNARRHKCGRKMIEEILSLGFEAVEIGHGVGVTLLEGILEAKEKHGFRVSSVHNFLPNPVEVSGDSPDCYEFTSHRPGDRSRAAKLTRQTIDWAERLGAPFVVVHCGRVPRMFSAKLRAIVESGGLFGREFCREKLAAVREREKIAPAFLERTASAVAELAAYAGTKGIRLGIENREDFEVVPGEREIPDFLKRFDPAHAGYWHDFGHAQIKDHLHLIDHRQWLEKAAPLAIGSHVHDVHSPFRDHRAPFTGVIDFATLVPLFPKDCQFVFELSPSIPVEEVHAAKARWRELGLPG